MSARSSNSAAATDPAGPDGPVRTCVGCRTRERSVALLRIVAVDGVLHPDPRHRLPGRGAWLHPTLGCLDAAERRRAFGRALRLTGPPDGTKVRALLTSPEPESRSTPK
ncbi:MAG: YlxR family protein [Nakamurella sp.]